MRSSFAAFLRGFTLPFGATTGRRIVFNGDDGTIVVYRADDTIALIIGGPGSFEDSIRFLTGDVDEQLGGFITTGISGSGGTRNAFIQVVAPSFNGTSDFPFLSIRSRSQNNTTDPAEFVLDHDGPEGRVRIPAIIGEAVLVAGTVTVARTSIQGTGSSRIFLSRRVVGGTPGFLSYSTIAGVSFTITSTSATDTSTVSYLILDE